MSRERTVLNAALAFAAMLFCAGNLRAAPSQGSLRVEWESLFEDAQLEYEYKAAALSPTDGSLWLAIGTRPKGKLGGPQHFLLWHLDRQGKKVGEHVLERLLKDQGVKEELVEVRDLSVTMTGDLVLIGDAAGAQGLLLKLEEKTARLTLVDVGGRQRLLTKIIPTLDGHFLLIGRFLGKGVLMKVTPSGKTVWEKVVNDENVTVFLDGLLTDKEVALVGSHMVEAGTTSVWVGKFSPAGDVLDRENFDGRYGHIVKSPSGYVVAYDKVGVKGWDLWLRGLKPDLATSWEAKIRAETKALSPLALAATPSGHLILAGPEDKKLWVAEATEGGEVVWSYRYPADDEAWPQLWNFALVSGREEFFVPFSMFVVNKSMEQRQIVGVIKLATK